MAISTTGPRSVSDATRFTSTTPHAASKTEAPPASSSTSRTAGRFSRTGAAGAAAATPRVPPTVGGRSSPSPLLAGETPEQRVARLRAAHEAAKKASMSKLDVIISRSRRFFDTAHKVTVLGLIGFTAVAGLLTVYTAADMIMYNKKRKAEFLEAQRKMEIDSLEAARLAYMTNKATPEQIALVEEAIERESGSGEAEGSIFGKLPSIIGAPKPISKDEQGGDIQTKVSDAAAAAWSAAQETAQGAQEKIQDATAAPKKKAGGIMSWFSSSLGKSEESEDVTKRFGWEGLSEEDDSAGLRESDLVRAIEDKQAALKAKASQALEREKERERTGGPLDRVGVDAEKNASTSKKWWPW